MRRTRLALVATVLVGGLAQLTQASGTAIDQPVVGLAPLASHEVRLQADGTMRYRGPLATPAVREDGALRTLLDQGPSEATVAAMAETTDRRFAASAGSAAATAMGRNGYGLPSLGSLPSFVGDLDGDGVSDLASLRYEDEQPTRLATTSGATGQPLWEQAVDGLVVPGRFAGAPGFLILDHRFEQGPRDRFHTSSFVVLEVEALGPIGQRQWQTEVVGTYASGALRSTATDIPDVQTAVNVTGSADDELVLTLAGERRGRLGIRPAQYTSTVAALDGADGSLLRGEVTAVSQHGFRWIEAFADLDGDGGAELLETRSVDRVETTHLLSGVGTPRWSFAGNDRYSWIAPAGGDLDVDGVGDLMIVSYDMTCTGPPEAQECVFEVTSSARSGRDGTVLGTWEDVFPQAVGDVDGDGRTDLHLGRFTRDDAASTFGLEVAIVDITGRTIRTRTHTHPLPEAPWEPLAGWGAIGDVDADGLEDTSWSLGRYQPVPEDAECPCASRHETLVSGRTSTLTDTDLAPLSVPWAWAVGFSFDGHGDDYFDLEQGDGNMTVRVWDGLSGDQLWATTVTADFSTDWASISWEDVDGDGGVEVLAGLHEPWDPEGLADERETYALLDGPTGAIRWQLPAAS